MKHHEAGDEPITPSHFLRCCISALTLGEASPGSPLWSIVLNGVLGAFAAPLDFVAQQVDLPAHDSPERVGSWDLRVINLLCVLGGFAESTIALLINNCKERRNERFLEVCETETICDICDCES